MNSWSNGTMRGVTMGFLAIALDSWKARPVQVPGTSGAPHVIDQGHGIIGEHVAAPGDVAVGAHQDKRFLVNRRGIRVIDIDDLQWHAPRASGGRQGPGVGAP